MSSSNSDQHSNLGGFEELHLKMSSSNSDQHSNLGGFEELHLKMSSSNNAQHSNIGGGDSSTKDCITPPRNAIPVFTHEQFIGLFVCKKKNGAKILKTLISYCPKKNSHRVRYHDNQKKYMEQTGISKIIAGMRRDASSLGKNS